MRTLLFLPLLLLLLATMATAQENTKSTSDDPWLRAGKTDAQRTELRRTLRQGVVRGDVAGGALLILYKGQPVFREGFGWADVEGKRKFTPDLPCRIASMTKPTTATVLLLLSVQGKLSLDDQVDKHLAEFESWEDAPTIRQLLSHTSGLPGQDERDAADKDSGGTLAGVVRNIARMGPVSRPGIRYRYSRLGFDVAARIAEVVTGSEYALLARTLLFEPLGMNQTRFRPNRATIGKMPTRYRRRGGQLIGSWLDMVCPKPAAYVSAGGGLVSTLDDLARFFRMHATGGMHGQTRITPRERLRELYVYQPGAKSYGLGFNLQGKQPVRRIQHGGASGTLGWVDLANDVVAIVLTQTVSRDSRGFQRKVQRAVDKVFGGSQNTSSTATPEERAKELLARWDLDRDKRLTRQEIPAKQRRHFARLDANSNGTIDLAELTRALAAASQRDR